MISNHPTRSVKEKIDKRCLLKQTKTFVGYCSYWWLNSNLGKNLKKQQHIRWVSVSKEIGITHKNIIKSCPTHPFILLMDKIPNNPPGMLKKNLFINGDNHHPWWCRILSSPFFVASLCWCHLLGSIKVHHWQQAHGACPQGLDFFTLRLTP